MIDISQYEVSSLLCWSPKTMIIRISSIIFLFNAIQAFAIETVDLLTLSPKATVYENIEYYIEDQRRYDIDEIINEGFKGKWKKGKAKPYTGGFNHPPIWMRLSLQNNSSDSIKKLFQIRYPLLDQIVVYFVSDKEITNEYHMGDYYPHRERPIFHRLFLFNGEFPPHTNTHIYIRINTTSSLTVPIIIWDEAYLLEDNEVESILIGGSVLVLIMMLCYNFLIFVSTKDKTYLSYVFFVACVIISLVAHTGFGFQYLWPNSTFIQNQIFRISLPLATLGALQFGFFS